MITLLECVKCAGLASNEVILGAVATERHEALLASYLLNLGKGRETVLNMIVSDLRGFLDLGALERASDTLLVLRLFLSRCPAAQPEDESLAPEADELQHEAASILAFARPGEPPHGHPLPEPQPLRCGGAR